MDKNISRSLTLTDTRTIFNINKICRCYMNMSDLRSSSHDANHLLSCRMPHEPLINDAGHVVVASSQSGQRSQTWSGRQTLGLGFIDCPEDGQGVSLGPFPGQRDSSLATTAAHIPEELLDQTVPMGSGLGPADCRRFPCSWRVPGWTGSWRRTTRNWD